MALLLIIIYNYFLLFFYFFSLFRLCLCPSSERILCPIFSAAFLHTTGASPCFNDVKQNYVYCALLPHKIYALPKYLSFATLGIVVELTCTRKNAEKTGLLTKFLLEFS